MFFTSDPKMATLKTAMAEDWMFLTELNEMTDEIQQATLRVEQFPVEDHVPG